MARDCEKKASAGPTENDTCRRCGEAGHFAKDCEQAPIPRDPCRNCGEEGHFSRDCEKPKRCRNCDAEGHGARDCPKPRDWSRVECKNCHESKWLSQY